ncbi:hypothetical protein [Verminephrobacter eiseniae]|uniref:hypothetical protein n=1 Tax=Verminephrobacter eiseniae TaxID=364317 RepID=UPI002238F196|nr:hypothetical protein [Verminephrobacter eiseniae]
MTDQRRPAQTAWATLCVLAAKVLGRLEATTITALLLIPVLSLPCAALGATDPIGAGLAWLQSQILSDGQLSRTSALVAPTQARCETAKTLLRLSGSSPAVVTLTSTLASDAATSTQALVCQSHLHRLLGSIANAGLAERSVAGGYSAYPGLRSPARLSPAARGQGRARPDSFPGLTRPHALAQHPDALAPLAAPDCAPVDRRPLVPCLAAFERFGAARRCAHIPDRSSTDTAPAPAAAAR